MIQINNKQYRNLEEQVQYLTNYHDVNQGLIQWGIRVVGTVETEQDLPENFTGAYGDAYAVGTEPPYFFYIWTRANTTTGADYWFPFGEISIIGPVGPVGPAGPQGDQGTRGTRMTASTAMPAYQPLQAGYLPGDTWLRLQGLGSAILYQLQENGTWSQIGNMAGPQGIQGPVGPQGEKGDQGERGPQGPRGDVGGFINIVGIIPNISQLPTPSSLANLTKAFLVGVEAPYDLWIQIGDTSETAMWENTGPLNAGTMVLVDGNYVNILNADEYLKPPAPELGVRTFLFSSNSNVPQWVSISSGAVGNSLVRRDTYGKIFLKANVAIDTFQENEAIPRYYIDAVIGDVGTAIDNIIDIQNSLIGG